MQRKATKKSTRAANSEEKRFMAWVKHQPCIVCGDWPCNVDHALGSAYINNKVLIGHWFLLPLCEYCDNIKTQGSRRGFINKFGKMSVMWKELTVDYHSQIPVDVTHSISDTNM